MHGLIFRQFVTPETKKNLSDSFTHKNLCRITVIFAHFLTQNSAEGEIEIKQIIIKQLII